MELHENLSALRKAKGLSQEDMAEKLGVSRQAISKWENGLTSPEMANIAKLCEILEVTPNKLLGYEEDEKTNQPKIQHSKPQRPWWQYMLIVAGGIMLAHLIAFIVGIALFGTTVFIRKSQPVTEQHAEIIEFEQPVVNNFDFSVKEKKGNSMLIKTDFVPVINNDDYFYFVSVTEDDGKTKDYKAIKQGGVYTADIQLDISSIHRAKVVVLIEINGQTYSQYLATIREVTENSVAWE